MFRGKKKKKQQEKQPPATDKEENEYDAWIDHSKAETPKVPQIVEDTYDDWVDDANLSSKPQVEDEYDNWATSDHHLQNTKLPQVEDHYEFDAGPDVGNQEYEDVEGEGDIFGFDNKKGSSTKANKAPAVKGTPPTKRPVSMQPPGVPKGCPPSGRPKSMQSPTYMNVKQKQVMAASYEIPQDPSYINVKHDEAGESYEEMEDLNLKPTYMNVASQDVGGESYEEMDDLELNKTVPTASAESDNFYEDVLPDEPAKKPPTGNSIIERQQQLQNKEIQEPPKKRNLAADYQKKKFEMLAQKFKDIDTAETKLEPTPEKKKPWPPPKSSSGVESTPEKGAVGSLTRSFQSGASKAKDKVTMKGLLWHKAPGHSKYHEEHCELEGDNFKMFRNKNDPKPYFTIITTKCELAAAPEEYEKKNAFKLTAGVTRDYFGAFNAGEMKSWMNALRPVVKAAK